MSSRFVTIDEVVNEASTYIGEATDLERLMMRQWVYRALNLIGPADENIKVCEIAVKDYAAVIPNDCVGLSYILDLALKDAHDNDIPYRYESGKERIHERIFTDSIPNEIPRQTEVSVDNKTIILSNNPNVKKVKLRYFSLSIDSNGDLMITEDMVFALVCFIRLAWAMRKNDNRSQIQQDREMWLGEMQRVKANRKMPSELEMRDIVKKWMTLIPALNRRTYNNF